MMVYKWIGKMRMSAIDMNVVNQCNKSLNEFWSLAALLLERGERLAFRYTPTDINEATFKEIRLEKKDIEQWKITHENNNRLFFTVLQFSIHKVKLAELNSNVTNLLSNNSYSDSSIVNTFKSRIETIRNLATGVITERLDRLHKLRWREKT